MKEKREDVTISGRRYGPVSLDDPAVITALSADVITLMPRSLLHSAFILLAPPPPRENSASQRFSHTSRELFLFPVASPGERVSRRSITIYIFYSTHMLQKNIQSAWGSEEVRKNEMKNRCRATGQHCKSPRYNVRVR